MDLEYLRASLDEAGNPVLVPREVDNGEEVWRRVPRNQFSEDRDLPTKAAFRDQRWDSRKKELKQEHPAGAARNAAIATAKSEREISVNLAKEMREPVAATLVDGPDRSGTDYVVGLNVGLIRQRASLQVAHTPLSQNIAHADILGDYEKPVPCEDGELQAREFLAFNSDVRYRPSS